MEEHWFLPPASKALLTPISTVVKRLEVLIGRTFPLTGKTRTDGAALRHLVADVLDQYPLPLPAGEDSYQVVPPKQKGVPRMRREFIETYLVTSGTSYNLQVWNRNPAADSVQIEYESGLPLLASDVRFIFVRVDTVSHKIRCVVVLTPEYIEVRFGRFGKPTIKQQLIITARHRSEILDRKPPILFHPDSPDVRHLLGSAKTRGDQIRDRPVSGMLLPIEEIRELVARPLIGTRLSSAATKNRGQALELMVAGMLGYSGHSLVGSHPDIANQALEVKVQDATTVDLGKYSPQFDELVPLCPGFTTRSVRYLIALTDAVTGVVEGIVLAPGERLGDHFAFVSDSNFKSQRSIPMSFFGSFDGMSISNPV